MIRKIRKGWARLNPMKQSRGKGIVKKGTKRVKRHVRASESLPVLFAALCIRSNKAMYVTDMSDGRAYLFSTGAQMLETIARC